MKIYILIISLFMMLQLDAQPIISSDSIKIYNAEDLINIAKTKGINELKEIINPIHLIFIDSSYTSLIIDLEFKTGLWNKHYINKKIVTYELPELTMELVDYPNNTKAGEKLFDYYSSLPKHYKSDTLFEIYNYYNLNNYLHFLAYFSSPQLIEKLKQDYNEWTLLAKMSPAKKYPTYREICKSDKRFNSRVLYVDCNLMTLQIAGALNYLNVKGFNDSLINKLMATQTFSYAKNYYFPKPITFDSEEQYNFRKTIQNTIGIQDFRKDYIKLEKLIRDNFENSFDSKLYKIIEKGSKAIFYMLGNHGFETYSITLNSDNIIVEEIESAFF